jgi:hypothetical protein
MARLQAQSVSDRQTAKVIQKKILALSCDFLCKAQQPHEWAIPIDA